MPKTQLCETFGLFSQSKIHFILLYVIVKSIMLVIKLKNPITHTHTQLQ